MALAKVQERLDRSVLIEVAEEIGLPRKKFVRLMESGKYDVPLAQSRKEALANKVKVTPTFFIDGQRYRSYKDPRWIVDAVEYGFGMMGGRR
jgi:predicted DsbA family dithiol-disulfide isomerase